MSTDTLGNSASELVADFNSVGPAATVNAGQLTQLMLRDDPGANITCAIQHVGDDRFTAPQRWAMYQLFTRINELRRPALGQLGDIPENVRTIVLNEIIRALFKGEIPLDGMTVEGFVAETRKYAAPFLTQPQEQPPTSGN